MSKSSARPDKPKVAATEAAAPRKPASRRQQRRAVNTREKIIAAATTGFAKHGYDGVSTRMICEAAGVQHTLITYHFKNKEGLWKAVLANIVDRQKKRVEARARNLSNLDDVTKLRLTFEEFIRSSALNPEVHALMSHTAAKSDERLTWLVDTMVRDNAESWVALIRSAQEAGRFVQGDPYVLYYTFLGAATRAYMLAGEIELLTGRSPFTLDYVEEHVEACLKLFFIDPPE